MDSHRLDSVAKALAGRRASRRTTAKAAALGLGAAAVGRRGFAQDASPEGSTDSNSGGGADLAPDGAALFVQTATSGTFVPNPNAGAATPIDGGVAGDFVLTLNGHAGQTIAFADRPSRNFSEVKTDSFIDGLGFPDNDPPNAAIVTGGDVLIVELFTPVFDGESGTLRYGASVLQSYSGEGLAPVAAQQLDRELATEFGAASLFIDDCSDGTASCSTSNNCWGNIRYGRCWSWSALGCQTCADSRTLNAQCNAEFSGCNGNCVAQTDYKCTIT